MTGLSDPREFLVELISQLFHADILMSFAHPQQRIHSPP